MTRFKKGSPAAKAWGRRMKALRRKSPTTRKRKHSFRRKLRHVRKILAHPIRHIRRHRRHRKAHIKKRSEQFPIASGIALGLLGGNLAAQLGLSPGSITGSGGGGTGGGGPPPVNPKISESPLTFSAAGNLNVTGSGFTPNGTVTFEALTPGGSVVYSLPSRADSNGNISFAVPVSAATVSSLSQYAYINTEVIDSTSAVSNGIAVFFQSSGGGGGGTTTLTQTQISGLTTLLVNNGGASSTINSIVNNSYPVGLSATFNQLAGSPNAPGQLLVLLTKYGILTSQYRGSTVGQVLLILYNLAHATGVI